MNIISLTTIPPRMDRIGETLEALVGQSLKPDRVILNIPRTYRRPTYTYEALPAVPSGVDILISDIDHGPATKILPALKAYQGQAVNIVFCDDDRLYPHHWLENLVANARRHPGECITVAAGLISQIEAYYTYVNQPRPRFLAPLYKRLYALKKIRPEPGYTADIACGYGGVLVRPDFFDDTVFDIRDEFYTLDDTWLSGHLARRGITIRVAEDADLPHARDIADLSSLKDLKTGALNQNAIDVACIRYFRDTYGIWK